jgi:uncharacterized protein
MELKLTKKPKGVTIIEGFAGLGLIGTISTEYLMEHLDFQPIGKVIFDDAPAVVAIHQGSLIEPLGIFFNKESNLVLIHGLNLMYGNEWELTKLILELYSKLEAKEIISIEGVGAPEQEIEEGVPDGSVFFYSNKEHIKQKMNKLKIDSLQDGIIMGITSALMVKSEKVPLMCLFAKVHSKLPDSKAAAEIIRTLDMYLGLKVDYKPLIRKAEEFEGKLKQILTKSAQANQLKEDKRRLDYLG